MNRRGFLTRTIAAAVAPAIIRTPGLIMPVKPMASTCIDPEFARLCLGWDNRASAAVDLNEASLEKMWVDIVRGVARPMRFIPSRLHHADDIGLPLFSTSHPGTTS